MRPVDARGGMPARLSRRTLLAGAAAATAMPAIVRASEPCPDELEHALSMHHYRLQFQSWSGPARSGGGHVVSHCVRSIASSMAFVDWKGPGLAGYVDDSAPLFVQRTYSRAGFTHEPTVLWYGSRPTDRDTDIVIPRTSAIEVDVPHTSAGAFYLPNEAMVRAAWASSVSADDNLGDLRARAEKAAASQFMRVNLWFSTTLQKGDRAEAPARAGYNGTCTIDTRGNALTGVFGLRLADATAHRTVFGASDARPLTRGTGRVTDEFGGTADLGARPPASFALKPTRLMIVGPDGETPIASIGVGVIA
ncbi:MAG: hypothetical protein AB7O88_26110 [Reyranellaceae bacterium]